MTAAGPPETTGALAGLTVVDASGHLAGQYAARLLADKAALTRVMLPPRVDSPPQ